MGIYCYNSKSKFKTKTMSKQQSVNPVEKPTPEYASQKIVKGGILGVIAMRAVKGKQSVLSEEFAKRMIAKESTVDGRKLSLETRKTVESLTKQTEYWHGTGRFQYRNGKIVDVLQGMIQQRGLQPQRDDIDLVGVMHSVSLARSRAYARAYADMHENGKKGERHGSAHLWAAAFIGPLALGIIKEEKMWRSENRRRVQEHFNASNSAKWYEKVRKEPTGTLGIFAHGSDIEGNYPILFGIRKGIVTPAETSQSVAMHEVRSTDSISWDDLTHVEVPEEKVVETKTLLEQAGYEMPIMSIECFETYASGQPFHKLVT